MTLEERLRQLASALPCDHSAVTMTRADLMALLERDGRDAEVWSTRDLTVERVADETNRAPSTVRGWLIWGRSGAKSSTTVTGACPALLSENTSKLGRSRLVPRRETLATWTSGPGVGFAEPDDDTFPKCFSTSAMLS